MVSFNFVMCYYLRLVILRSGRFMISFYFASGAVDIYRVVLAVNGGLSFLMSGAGSGGDWKPV